MKKTLRRLKMDPVNNLNPEELSKWLKEQEYASVAHKDVLKERARAETNVENKPIEPEGRKLTRPGLLKWIIFLLFIVYVLISYYRAPILTSVGRYLVVQHSIKKADLIICLMGNPVERGLAAAELYEQGMAPRILFAREELPDGIEVLEQKGVHFPETRDLLKMMLQGLGVPKSDLVASEQFVHSTYDEAKLMRDIVHMEGYHSLIIVTSPTHTRRAWLTFRRVFEKDNLEIMMMPSQYTDFKPEDWWKKGKYLKEVIIEYQKLIYYMLRYL